MGEGIYGLDLDGLATFANPESLSMLGYEPGDFIGEPLHALSITRAQAAPPTRVRSAQSMPPFVMAKGNFAARTASE